MKHLPSQLENIVSSLNGLKDDIEQLQNDNKKLNDDLLVLEKSRDEAYKSFNTETHMLVEREFLKNICGAAEDVSGSAQQASDEVRGISSCADEAR